MQTSVLPSYIVSYSQKAKALRIMRLFSTSECRIKTRGIYKKMACHLQSLLNWRINLATANYSSCYPHFAILLNDFSHSHLFIPTAFGFHVPGKWNAKCSFWKSNFSMGNRDISLESTNLQCKYAWPELQLGHRTRWRAKLVFITCILQIDLIITIFTWRTTPCLTFHRSKAVI